jgi:hypothetical protein
MAKEPDERPDAEELIDEAAGLLGISDGGFRTTAAGTTVRKRTRAQWLRRPLRTVLAAGAGAVPVIATAVTLFSGGDDGGTSATEYRDQIGVVCSGLDERRAEKPARNKRLQRRLKRAKTLRTQRNALYEEYNTTSGWTAMAWARSTRSKRPATTSRPIRSRPRRLGVATSTAVARSDAGSTG